MSHLFYRNQRLLLLAISLIVVAGLAAYHVLPRLEDPLLTSRFAIIHTRLPGADAERVEALVTDKLEEELQTIEEIKELRSVSRVGVSTINIELRDDIYFTDTIWSRTRDKLRDAAPLLPSAAQAPAFEELEVKAYARIVALVWDRPGQPNYAILRRLAEQLEDVLLRVPGSEEVDTFGDPVEEVVATIDPERVSALGLTPVEVAHQIAASDAKVSAGQLRGQGNDWLLEVDAELDSLNRIEETPIRTGNRGQVVRLRDVAEVTKGIVEPPSSLAFVSGRPAVTLGILVRSHVRIDDWNVTVQQALDNFQQTLPEGVRLDTIFEQNRYVTERLQGLLGNLLLGGLAVVAVITFLMGWRNALIVGAALPLAGLMVLAGLRLLGIPIHQMSITGLIIALGLLIDNAIVMVEDVNQKLRKGLPPASAVSSSVRHLAVPLFGSTFTTTLAFAPIALMEGPAGEFVGSIAISVILAIVSSFVLAMTVTPAITAIIQTERASARSAGWWQRGFSHPALTQLYRRSLDWTLQRPLWGVALGAALPVIGFWQARQLPEQFFPPADRDQFQIELELAASASLRETTATIQAVRDIVVQHPMVEDLHWFLGESAPTFYYNVVPRRKNTSYYAQALVQLGSAAGATELIHTIQAELDQAFPHARLLVRQLEQGPPFDAPIEIRLFGPDLDRLQELGDDVRRLLVDTPGVLHTRSDLTDALPKLALRVDEEAARLAGLDHRRIADQLDANLEGAQGGSVLEATEQLPVRVRIANQARGDLAKITSLELIGQQDEVSPGRLYSGIPLSSLAEIQLQSERAAIPRLQGSRMNEIQAFIPAGVLPAEVLSRFQAELAAADFEVPPGYRLEYGGESAKRDDAIGNLMASVGVLLVLMLATLVLSFGSFRIAGVISLVGALAVGLGLGAVWLFGYPFGFMAIVGTMGLVGVAINDTIVVIAGIRADSAARRGEPSAVHRVVLASTRHVVATSLTTMAGFAPLVMAGGGFWPPLAIAIAGGVGGATILAVYFAPSAYILTMCRGRCQESEMAGLAESTERPGTTPMYRPPSQPISTNTSSLPTDGSGTIRWPSTWSGPSPASSSEPSPLAVITPSPVKSPLVHSWPGPLPRPANSRAPSAEAVTKPSPSASPSTAR